MIFALLACAGDRGPDTCEGFAPVPWDPVWEDDVRIDDDSAVWTAVGATTLSTDPTCDGACLSIAGTGGASAPLRVNRMADHHVTGTLTTDGSATITIVHTSPEGTQRVLYEGTASAGSLTIDETFAVEAAGPDVTVTVTADSGTTTTLDGFALVAQRWAPSADPPAGTVHLGFLIHLEEGDFITDEGNFQAAARVIEGVSQVLAAHGAKLTIQADTSFVRGMTIWDPGWVVDRDGEGADWSVHVHDEADAADLEQAFRDGRVTLAEAGAATTDINGGFNFAPWFDMYRAGYRSLSAYKDGSDQSGLPRVQVEPWRPADGVGTSDPDAFLVHDPDGPLVYLPGHDIREVEHSRFPEASANVLSQVLAHARDGYVDSWYFVLHVDGFTPPYGGDLPTYLDEQLDDDLAWYDAFLGDTVDPLVADGRVVYATTMDMYDAYAEWEAPCREEE